MQDDRESTARRGTGQKMVAAAAAAAVAGGALAWLGAGSPAATAEEHPESAVTWRPCPAYSDDVIRAQGVSDERIPVYRAQLNRMECGTVSVPLDYRQRDGRQITVAITRLRAVDQAHRLGSIAVNPGGPGGSGYLMPIKITMYNAESTRLNNRYDLIGFDPRGVGYSTKVNCPGPGGGPGPAPSPSGDPQPPGPPGGPAPGPLTEEAARRIYDSEVAANAACGQSDPDFLGQLTTLNVARDLDRVRIALGEQKLNFLGVSWGTRLGAAYRSTFPGKVGHMFLDSVVSPMFRQDDFAVATAAATERTFLRMAEWIALHHDTYGLGTTPAQVRTAILALVGTYDTNPKRYTDLPRAVDGAVIANLASQSSPDWPKASEAFKQLQDTTRTTAPAALKDFFSPGIRVPDAPEVQNVTARQAINCNEDPSQPEFSAAWAAYQRLLAQNPVTGRGNKFTALCAGWPLPVQELRLHRGGGSLALAGHLNEQLPYEWTTQMHATIGGTVFTVNDDVHGSVLKVPDCAAKLVSYFTTGRIDRGCDGSPMP